VRGDGRLGFHHSVDGLATVGQHEPPGGAFDRETGVWRSNDNGRTSKI
jgi:hypothetical protein